MPRIRVIRKRDLRIRSADLAHFMERIQGRWRELGWTVENIRKNVARDLIVGDVMTREARL